MEMTLRDRIDTLLAENGLPNGEADIDDIENQAWDDISDSELEQIIFG